MRSCAARMASRTRRRPASLVTSNAGMTTKRIDASRNSASHPVWPAASGRGCGVLLRARGTGGLACRTEKGRRLGREDDLAGVAGGLCRAHLRERLTRDEESPAPLDAAHLEQRDTPRPDPGVEAEFGTLGRREPVHRRLDATRARFGVAHGVRE